MAGGSFGGGDGSAGNPYLVEDAADLNAVRNDLSAYYRQIVNINLSDYSPWIAIGNPLTFEEFTGNYDGGRYKITNLLSEQSLFAISFSASFTDINIENAIIDGDLNYCGILSDYIDDCLINNVHVSGTITNSRVGLTRAGGIAGRIDNTNLSISEVVNCSFKGAITTISTQYSRVGGLFGEAFHSNISQCFADVNITVPGGATGGLVGECFSSANIYNSYSLGQVTNNSSGGGSGGIVGNLCGQMEKCYSATIIDGTSTSLGGLVGNLESSGAVISSYYDSEISGQSDVTKGEPRTTAQMTDPYDEETTYINWNFDEVWFISPTFNDGYPTLEEEPTPDPFKLYFIEPPQVNIIQTTANSVTVVSPTNQFTASTSGISSDEVIERVVSIDEGDESICQSVAEKLLARWSRKQINVIGDILYNQDLDFRKKIKIIILESNINEYMPLQKAEHDVIAYKTTVTVGDIILSDNELLTRILDQLGA